LNTRTARLMPAASPRRWPVPPPATGGGRDRHADHPCHPLL